jgi:leucyl aminopeptidase (aminopeptidase T)
MAKIRVLSVKKQVPDSSSFRHVKCPDTGFAIELDISKALAARLEEPKLRARMDTAAKRAYAAYRQQTIKRLQKFEKLFAGMLAKGAAPDAVAKQADAVKKAIEKDTHKWEKSAARALGTQLEKWAKQKR